MTTRVLALIIDDTYYEPCTNQSSVILYWLWLVSILWPIGWWWYWWLIMNILIIINHVQCSHAGICEYLWLIYGISRASMGPTYPPHEPPSVHRWGFMIYHFGVEIFKIYTIFKCYFSNISIVPPYRYIYIKDIINTLSFDICVY